MDVELKLTVLIPVSERYDDVSSLHYSYKTELEKSNYTCEFIYVLDGDYPDVLDRLNALQREEESIKIVTLARTFGYSTAINVGLEFASHENLLILPAFYQVEPAELLNIVNELDRYDMVVARRSPRVDPLINRIQAHIFNRLASLATDQSFHDLGCMAQAMKRHVLEEIDIYGEHHRLLPVIASHRGFKVKEVAISQSKNNTLRRLRLPRIYIGLLLDIITVLFLTKFTKKPLRFFGGVGAVLFSTGAIAMLYVIYERLFLGVALAERPALLLSVLILVLGFQLVVMGLIGELIIFTHAKEKKEYTIEKIIEGSALASEVPKAEASNKVKKNELRPFDLVK